MLKKFLLVAGLAMLERGSSAQLLLAILVSFIYLVRPREGHGAVGWLGLVVPSSS